MLLPIGQENSEVRRQPWVSYSLIVGNILVFLAVLVSGGNAPLDRASEKLRTAFQLLGEHPYLKPPPDIEAFLDDDDRQALADAARTYEKEGRLPDPFTRGTEQARLDALASEALELRRGSVLWRFGFIPTRSRPMAIFTSVFLHAGWLHLLGNMLFLLLSGPFIEDLYGRPLFAGLYVASGVAATLAHAGRFPASEVPLVGASGAIAGVMGAFLVRLSRARIQFVYMPLFPLVWRPRFTFFLPAFLVLPLWFGEQLLYGTTEARASGVGWWAHIGGFAFGAVLAVLVRLVRLEERVINPSIEKQISFEQHPGLEAALDFHARGQREAAGRAIQEVLAAQPDNLDAWRVAHDLAVEAGDAAAAGRAALRFLEISLGQGQHDLLPPFVEETLEAERPLPVRFYLTAARHFEKATDVHVNLALRLYAELAERHPGDTAAFRAEYRRGEILRRSGDPEAARRAFTRARAHPACTGELRDMVDRQLAAMDSAAARPRPAR